jgi:hypothetical protein
MKTKVCFYLFIISILAVACRNDDDTINYVAPNDTELKTVSRQRDSLIQLSARKDSSINAFISSFAEIENNLVSIRQKEEILIYHSKNNSEMRGSMKSKIDENIKIINELTNKNRQKIASLNAQLKEANYTITELHGLIDILIININNKNQDLISLNKALRANGNMLTKLNAEMIDLSGLNGMERDSIDSKTAELNTAYYTVGDIEQLKAKKIINEKGSVLSPTQQEKINPDFNKDYFKKIDITKKTRFDIYTKNAKLLSAHPSNSYTIEHKYNNTLTNIIVTNPAVFWSESKYLVVATD